MNEMTSRAFLDELQKIANASKILAQRAAEQWAARSAAAGKGGSDILRQRAADFLVSKAKASKRVGEGTGLLAKLLG